MSAPQILLVIAAICFAIAAVLGYALPDRGRRIDLIAVGLFFWVLSAIIK